MFGQSKPIAFEPYGRRRRRGRPPRWLVLLVTGMAIGAAGLYFAQERYLPPRLSAAESAELRSAYRAADAARAQLTSQLAEGTKRLDAALADAKKATDEAAAGRSLVDDLRGDLAAVVAALPPDPRGGTVEIRAARFAASGAALNYDVLLTRERGAGRPLAAVLKFSIAGQSARGVPVSFSPPPQAVSIGAHEVVRGSLALPDGLRPEQTTVQVLDRAGGKAIGMRVLLVK